MLQLRDDDAAAHLGQLSELLQAYREWISSHNAHGAHGAQPTRLPHRALRQGFLTIRADLAKALHAYKAMAYSIDKRHLFEECTLQATASTDDDGFTTFDFYVPFERVHGPRPPPSVLPFSDPTGYPATLLAGAGYRTQLLLAPTQEEIKALSCFTKQFLYCNAADTFWEGMFGSTTSITTASADTALVDAMEKLRMMSLGVEWAKLCRHTPALQGALYALMDVANDEEGEGEE